MHYAASSTGSWFRRATGCSRLLKTLARCQQPLAVKEARRVRRTESGNSGTRGHGGLGTTQRYMRLNPAALDAGIRLSDTGSSTRNFGDGVGARENERIIHEPLWLERSDPAFSLGPWGATGRCDSTAERPQRASGNSDRRQTVASSSGKRMAHGRSKPRGGPALHGRSLSVPQAPVDRPCV